MLKQRIITAVADRLGIPLGRGVIRGPHEPDGRPVRTGQRDVDDEDIRPQFIDRDERGLRLLGLAAHDEVRLPVDHQRQSLPHDRMVVHDEDPALRRHRHRV